MKILENKAHKERLCFICYNWKSANSLAIHANYSNTSNLGCKTSLAVKAASVGNKFRYLRCLPIRFAPFIPFRFLFLLSLVTMDYLLPAGSASPFVLTITNHQWWEGGKAQRQKLLEFLALHLSSLALSCYSMYIWVAVIC